MLTVNAVSKSYGSEIILKDVSFTVNAGERLGLIGPNGCGKTTLLRILVGNEKPDSGGFRFSPSELQIGYLPQGMTLDPGETIAAFLERREANPAALADELEKLASAFSHAPGQADLEEAYDRMLQRIEASSQRAGYVPEILSALGLGGLPIDTPIAQLSGGQKTRLTLAGVLLSDPDLLLLDEPTNHLDLDMLAWLESWLTVSQLTRRCGVLVVSHDRAFLDATVTGILELDPHTHAVKSYPGNYSDYLEGKATERQRQWQEYNERQGQIAQLRQAAKHLRSAAQFRRGGKADSEDKFAKGFFANRSKGTVGRAKHIERRLASLLAEQRIEKPGTDWQMKLEFGDTPESSRDVLVFEGLGVGYDGVPLVSGMDYVLRYRQRLVLVGPNGSGKTTLLRTIAGQIPPVAGRLRLGPSVRIGYLTQEQETFEPGSNALQTVQKTGILNETEARSFLHKFLFSGDDVFIPIRHLSPGERSRLALACLVASGDNLLLLDEPLNHLDIPSRLRFEQALEEYQGTVIAVVHDRYFIRTYATAVWEVRGGKLLAQGKK